MVIIATFVCAASQCAVLSHDNAQTEEFIKAIGDIDGGCEELIYYLSERDEKVANFVAYDTLDVNRTE